MKQMLYAGAGFLAGAGLIGLVIANPFGWTRLPGAGPASSGSLIP